MFDSLQQGSTKSAPQYELNSFVTTGFQVSPILEGFLASFGIPFLYLQMVPHMYDPASI